MTWQPFNATNDPCTCLWCGRKLRQKYHSDIEYGHDPTKAPLMCGCGCTDFEKKGPDDRPWVCKECGGTHLGREGRTVKSRKKAYDKPGDYGDGHFCGLRCGYEFGKKMADFGRRLQKAE